MKVKVIGSVLFISALIAQSAISADIGYKINGKNVSMKDVYKDNEGAFFDLEKKKHEIITGIATEAYLKDYWKKEGKKKGVSPEKAEADYLAKFEKVSEKEISEVLNRFKDSPQLKSLPDAEKRQKVVDYLKSTKSGQEIRQIVQQAIASKKLVVVYPKPKEPVFDVKVTKDDPVKYHAKIGDTYKTCKGDKCPITVVEYSEYQCPFCTRVLPTVERLMNDYKGKVRWIVRDFPLDFHKRATPAAIAARCAFDQGKFWQMYEELFKNQRALEDADLERHAKTVGLNMGKFKTCLKDPSKKAIVTKNLESGKKLGVTGTPAFFINGRRLSGALPYGQFKQVFDEELAGKSGTH